MPTPILRTVFLLCLLILISGCSSWQPTKNVWKSTKGLWNTYVSPPASVDYDDKGSLSSEAEALSKAILGIDTQLRKLERTMQNADKPPTQEWLNRLFASYPWLSGFAGVKYDGTILGQEPPNSVRQLDFIPLLYEDSKQNSRALRCDVETGAPGPEIMLATPLYDGTDFLGIVVAYFDMRSLMHFSTSPGDIVVLTPKALLWPGKYEYGATPLAGIDWEKVARESTAGTCSNSTGSFFYIIRYLGNLPIIFAIAEKGTFPEGNGSLEQAAAYFPQEHEKLPPPPVKERKNQTESGIPAFEKPVEPEPEPEPVEQQAPQRPAPMPEASDRNVIPQGSKDSMLLKQGKPKATRRVRERMLDGENISPEALEQRQTEIGLEPEEAMPAAPVKRPSPFGPREEAAPEPVYQRPSPFGPRQQPEDAKTAEPEAAPAASGQDAPETAPAEKQAPADTSAEKAPENTAAGEQSKPATLPGGRPSPFGPRN